MYATGCHLWSPWNLSSIHWNTVEKFELFFCCQGIQRVCPVTKQGLNVGVSIKKSICINLYTYTILCKCSRPHNKSVYSCIPIFPQKYFPVCLRQSSSRCQYVLCVIISVSDHDLLIGDGVCLKVKNWVQLRSQKIVMVVLLVILCGTVVGHADMGQFGKQ